MPTLTMPDVRTRPRLSARGLVRTAGRRRLLDAVSVDIHPGEVVAVVGPSGAGKTTLLRTLAGLVLPDDGHVEVDGRDLRRDDLVRRLIGYVPQDDIIHRDLPLRRTLLHAARLRLTLPAASVDALVDEVLDALDLRSRADVRVRDLSGGQRKRASIAVELLTDPEVLLLDEPTSGLDPATAAEVLRSLRRLADRDAAVALTTHAPADIELCDRVVVLAQGGCLVFDGPPRSALAWAGVTSWAALYELLAGPEDWGTPVVLDTRPPPAPPPPSGPPAHTPTPTGNAAGPRRLAQLATLVRRNADVVLHDRLTTAILVGAPLLVIAMIATLFEPGTLGTDPIGSVQLVFWIAFAGFFFGLTYGLLQIVTEAAVLRRERARGLSLGAYVAGKLVVLLPLLIAVDAGLFATLHALDRLPPLDAGTWLALGTAFLLDATAGLAIGLLASALVAEATQATLVLPMLCFPQVLFAGAMVPVGTMTPSGRGISAAMSNRWAFEALGRLLDLPTRFAGEGGAIAAWWSSFAGTPSGPLLVLAAMTLGGTAATAAVLHARTTPR